MTPRQSWESLAVTWEQFRARLSLPVDIGHSLFTTPAAPLKSGFRIFLQ